MNTTNLTNNTNNIYFNANTFYIHTLGCKVNQYESGALSALMCAAGFTPSLLATAADIHIINSCTVTETSDKKTQKLVRQLKKSGNIVVLTGCFPQAFPDIAQLSGADIVAGAADRSKIPVLLANFLASHHNICTVSPHSSNYEELPHDNSADKTRAYIKIEDGCDRFCSYCIIPTARGRVRSRALDSIVDEATFMANAGHKELVLVGINLSCYGKDIGLQLADVVEALQAIPDVYRIRLSSLEPELLTPQHIARLQSCDKLCPHFHLSLQSGCDNTLRAMNRHYTAAEYQQIVDNLRSTFENCAITTDIMVGFAGETDDDFADSLLFAQQIGFAKIHVFTYSIRKGTAAALRTDHVADTIKAQRYQLMLAAANSLHSAFLASQIGTKHNVLIEKQTSPDFVNGFTENYTPVRIFGSTSILPKRHDIVPIVITAANADFCTATQL